MAVADMAGHKDVTVTLNIYRGKSTPMKLAAAAMMITPGQTHSSELQQAVNAASGVFVMDGSGNMVGLPGNFNPDPTEAEIIDL